ncbi:MAG: oligosaccharide flippase family protein [Bacteroidetes bacterium]|nr:oligosaccharide flippase family protein [Bacteroidota bacterium]HET6245389.1 oligosaccharide flippase family protein [Bacteroidia bacterium]
MNLIRKLAGQTAIYGIPSILGRLLNYLLVPLYTRIFIPEEFGVVTELYAYVSFLIIILTYGMETALFRFTQTENNKESVYSTILISILSSSTVFILLFLALSPFIAQGLGYSQNQEYIIWFVFIIAFDGITAIPFAKLREQNKPLKFALVKFTSILSNILFILFFLVFCPLVYEKGEGILFEIISLVYSPQISIGYIFISNLLASIITVLLLIPYLIPRFYSFDLNLWKRMMKYSLPLLLAGLAGMTNETADRIMIKYLLPSDVSLYQLGIYGACYKIAILMTLFIQSFRFAAEPFFFAQYKEKNRTEIYAQVMNYFILAGSLIFLCVVLYIDYVQLFVGEKYREGIKIVPILLLANLFMGIFFNLSIWYKLSGKTMFGAYLTIIGAAITVFFNFLLIPKMGYLGAAWTTLICYSVMMVLSYIIGQKHFPVVYKLKNAGVYIFLAVIIYLVSIQFAPDEQFARTFFNTILLIAFLITAFLIEKVKKVVI